MEDILTLSSEDLDKRIEIKIGKKLGFKQMSDSRLIGRGSVYMFLNHFFNFSDKKVCSLALYTCW